MRALPILFRMAEDLRRLAMPSSHFLEFPWTSSSYRLAPWSQLNRLIEEDLTKISKDGYQVTINVSEFKPEELTVKVEDNSVVVEGKSEQIDDNSSYIGRHFIRRLALPKGYEAENAISTLTSDGVLTVRIPKPQKEENVREIPIQRLETSSIKSQESLSSSGEDSVDKPKET